MTYTHLTTDELVLIESYFDSSKSVSCVAEKMNRARQTIHNVYQFLKTGKSTLEFYQQYKANKKNCGRKPSVLPDDQIDYIKEKVAQGLTPDVIIGRAEKTIDCSTRTLYRMFKNGAFDCTTLPMKGKRKPNGHKEKRGRQEFKRSLDERQHDFPDFNQEFGHLEGDTIVGAKHRSAVITLVERQSKAIIALKPKGRKADDIEKRLLDWLGKLPRHLFRSITFDKGKELSNWKNICNEQDTSIFFADPGTPSQRALNENSNGLLRKDGLHKKMDFNQIDQSFVSSVVSRRNNIPRKSLNYRTPLEIFLSYLDDKNLSNLI